MSTRVRGKKELHYPVFHECAELVADEYWKSFFEDLGYGKYPKGLYISNETICSTNKRKAFTYCFTEKSAREIAKELHELILENTNLYSSRDLKKKKIDMELAKKEIEKVKKVDRFSMIKSKVVREMLIINFVIKMKYKYNLTWQQSKLLLSTISVAFLCKNIVSADVVYSNSEIKSINGLSFSDGDFQLLNASNLKNDDAVIDNIYLSNLWNRKAKAKNKLYKELKLIENNLEKNEKKTKKKKNDELEIILEEDNNEDENEEDDEN